MSTRRRYDTTALVTKMRQERRRNIVLGVCAAGTLAALVVFYLFNMKGMSIPEVPADASPRAPRAGEIAPHVTAAPAMGTPPSQPAAPVEAPTPPAKPLVVEEKPPVFSIVRSNMPAAALVWVDDAAVARGAQLQLTEGRHAVRVKIGKHSLREHIDVKPGENVELRMDARKKKLVVERHAASKSR